MSVLEMNGRVFESYGNEKSGWIVEIKDDGTEIELPYNYSSYNEADEALIAMIDKARAGEHS